MGLPDPEISIIIPTLDEAVELPRAIESVRRAFGARAQIIVADGGSRDRTLELAREHAAETARAGPGRGAQMNAGARLARADVLLFLHADSRLPADARAAIARALDSTDVVGGCFPVRLHGPTADRPIARALATAIALRSRVLRTATGDQAIFCRRATFERAGGYPEIELFEDVMLYRALRQLGAVVVLDTPATTSDRRWRANGYLRTIVAHLALRVLFSIGVGPNRLARLYANARSAPELPVRSPAPAPESRGSGFSS